MAKQARYTGPFEEVRVGWPPGETLPSEQQTWVVKRGSRLPDDAPAALRDELLESEDWQESQTQQQSKSESKEGGE